jgi:Ca2+-binding RTX toxin-like protein
MDRGRVGGVPAAVVGVLAAAAGVVLVPAAAGAADTTCQGLAATLVGTPGSDVTGTAGPDVVVSDGAALVSTGDGDDVVCVTGTAPDGKRVRVFTGAGADRVEVTSGDDTIVGLGLGADTLRGGSGSDRVSTGELEELSEQGDTDRDDVATGAGDDVVLSGQDGSTAPNQDVLDLGDGDDSLTVAGGSGSVAAEGGAGHNALAVRTGDDDGPGSWVLDNRAGTAALDGAVRWSWHGFTRFDLKHLGYYQPLVVLGSDRAEAFWADERGAGSGPVTVEAGDGRDLVVLSTSHRGAVDGQAGHDLLEVYANPYCGPKRCGSLDLDLAGHTARTHGDGGRGRFEVRGFESATAHDLGDVRLRGDAGRNRLTAEDSCAVVLRGRAGADVLRLQKSPDGCSKKGGPAPTSRLDGGPGDDTLTGSRFADTLLGGPGRDRADGAGGRDRCVAERRTSCER